MNMKVVLFKIKYLSRVKYPRQCNIYEAPLADMSFIVYIHTVGERGGGGGTCATSGHLHYSSYRENTLRTSCLSSKKENN